MFLLTRRQITVIINELCRIKLYGILCLERYFVEDVAASSVRISSLLKDIPLKDVLEQYLLFVDISSVLKDIPMKAVL